jgi:hypothetical protein
MNPEKGTKADKAFQAGRNAYAQGLSVKENPFMLSKYIAMSNWWVKGFNELQEIK